MGWRLQNTFFSKDGEFFCGEADYPLGGHHRFFARWEKNAVAYDGDGHYTYQSYLRNCDATATAEEIAKENQRTSYLEIDVRRQQAEQRAEAKHKRWVAENADALQALHEATQNPK